MLILQQLNGIVQNIYMAFNLWIDVSNKYLSIDNLNINYPQSKCNSKIVLDLFYNYPDCQDENITFYYQVIIDI